MPSHYQNDLFTELSKYYDEFEVIYAHTHDDARKSLGWNFENAHNFNSKTIGRDLTIWKIIPYLFKNRKSTHIVNGIWAESIFFFVIILLNLFQINFLIYSEASNPFKNRSFLKKIILRFVSVSIAKLLIIKAKGVLAISIFASNYFKDLGINDRRIYRFGYFQKEKIHLKLTTKKSCISLLFVGQLIERKGIFTLLEAIEKLFEKYQSFHLSIIGSGILKDNIQHFIKTQNLQNEVELLGVIDSQNVSNYIAQADLLVLPSVFDGWGIVVNEALQNGISVLISDQCGAKELIREGKNGFIFKANNVNDITEKLTNFIELSPHEKLEMMKEIRKMNQNIDIQIVTKYLVACVAHSLNQISIKPTAPWLK
ncbi:glycosyltransferase involved in cell wall biosynthesis [Arcicella aurantiaca]|uniref:Glycosyltransferase involved in cell wall biosynthesis n=2 Tax=Arcicella aurantiaca TaxID=591202 RepID=A0A316EJF8_9BACT|nr:glycosyltransferase involved in cell wall biosynthesis [Arcicella aurantiaca]